MWSNWQLLMIYMKKHFNVNKNLIKLLSLPFFFFFFAIFIFKIQKKVQELWLIGIQCFLTAKNLNSVTKQLLHCFWLTRLYTLYFIYPFFPCHSEIKGPGYVFWLYLNNVMRIQWAIWSSPLQCCWTKSTGIF